MQKIFKWIKKWTTQLIIGLVAGMRKTESDMFTAAGISTEVGSEINQQVRDNRISKKLLRGEITQEVKELVWRTYKVDRESHEYEYFSPTLAKKKGKKVMDEKAVKYENSENMALITIQGNNKVGEKLNISAYASYDEKGNQEDKETYKKEDSVDVGEVEYTVHITRQYTARYRIEEFIRRVVVKQDGVVEEGDKKVRLDLYVSKYPNSSAYKSKGFVREVERIMQSGKPSDVYEFETLSFVTNKAAKFYDGVKFVFGDFQYVGTVEYDGCYIIKFDAQILTEEDLIEKYRCEELDEKYERKAPKETTIQADIYADSNIQTYRCAECGKEVTYDLSKIDGMAPKEARLITDEKEDSDNTEYYDLQMSKEVTGRMLCKDCMAKHMTDVYQNAMKTLERRTLENTTSSE